MRHLTTEELLLHCDGALAPELAVHVDECPACRDSWLHLQTVLFEAEAVLRSSVPPEPADHRAASQRNLELALYPPTAQHEFPLRWPVVYSAAAALTLMTVSGYLSTRQAPPDALQMASVQTAPAQTSTLQAEAASSLGGEVAEAAPQPATNIEATDLVVPPAESVLIADASEAEPEAVANEVEPARFELAPPSGPQADVQQVAWLEPPSVSASPANVPAALVPGPPLTTFRTFVEEASGDELARLSSPSAFANVIEGYWLLTQSKVWEEDLRPVWTSRGLVIEGTVEDAVVRDRVRLAVLRQAPQAPAFEIRLREELPAAQQTPNGRVTRVVHSSYNGAAGGTVRRSLLSHFSDAARRSFVSPQPSALEAELVRYVSEVYSSQSELLSHAYALHRFLGRLDTDQLASADAQSMRRFRELVRFHLGALDEREAAIYDHLSEALPRKVWSYRGDALESNESIDWRVETQGLLQDTLELDSNLTALFGSPAMTVDASNPEQSCGELLHRIRTRIRRIKNRTQAL